MVTALNAATTTAEATATQMPARIAARRTRRRSAWIAASALPVIAANPFDIRAHAPFR